MIEVTDLSEQYGDHLAVDHLSFGVELGRVTGFLGPNGAGKSTTMRLIIGLDHADTGTATIEGRRYADLARPLRTVGALLEAKAMHPGRSAYHHLLFLAQSQGLPRRRVDDVLALVGLTEVARQRIGGYSPDAAELAGLITAQGGTVASGAANGEPPGTLSVTGMEAPRIGELAARSGLVLHELTPRLASLEEAFLERTAGRAQYTAPGGRRAPEPQPVLAAAAEGGSR
jgi:hypothetical protein